MNLPSNFPILTWLSRQWLLILVFLVTNWMCLSEIHFAFLGKWSIDPELGGIWRPATPIEFCGPLLWAIPFGIAAYLIGSLLIHLHFRATIDKDINDGSFVGYWNAAPSDLKLKLVFAAIIGIFLGVAILLSPLARA